MRTLLILLLILYDIVAIATRMTYDYEDMGLRDEKRFLRKKEEDRRRQEYDNRYYDEMDGKAFGEERLRDRERDRDRGRDRDFGYRRYEDVNKLSMTLDDNVPDSGHLPYIDKEPEKKKTVVMNCDRPHERYEACFAGCASVSCDNPRERLRPCYPFCEPGCVCVLPHVRDDRTHKCVLPDDCTKGLKGIPDLGDEV